ncbi:MAG: type 2 isopentenyl-diphosphate Delta-isomerase [Oligoflexus sp.]
MEVKTDRVKLASPLPWISDAGPAGFVTELSEQQLTLQVHESISFSENQMTIKVILSQTQSFLFSGTLQSSSGKDQVQLLLTDVEQIHQARDLLGQIRKSQHIELCRRQDVEASDRFTGFERVHFIPEALPNSSIDRLDTKVSFLGGNFHYPILITGMTGGVDQGTEINRRLAAAAAKFRIPMGIGSQRIALENPAYADIFHVKRWQPDVFLIGNLGFAQLLQDHYLELCEQAVDMIQADALAIHLNVLQEAVQVEGDRHFDGVLERLHLVCEKLRVPVMIKEVGSGISPNTCLRLRDAGVASIDIGGRGGTSWGYIEGLRSASQETQSLGKTFRDWGIPTAYSLASVRSQLKDFPLVATGGIRDGLTVAKAVALGANMVGIGLPLLRAALQSEEAPQQVLETFVRGLKVTMLATGSQSLDQLEQHLSLGLPLESNFEAWVRSKSFY